MLGPVPKFHTYIHNPIAICLQHAKDIVQSIGNFTLAAFSVPSDENLGTAIYVNNNVTHDNVSVSTSEFQLCGIKLNLKGNNTFNLFNIYN